MTGFTHLLPLTSYYAALVRYFSRSIYLWLHARRDFPDVNIAVQPKPTHGLRDISTLTSFLLLSAEGHIAWTPLIQARWPLKCQPPRIQFNLTSLTRKIMESSRTEKLAGKSILQGSREYTGTMRHPAPWKGFD